MMTSLRANMLLSDVASAVARVAVAAPKLAASEVCIVAVPARVPLTRLRISTSDRDEARSLAGILDLADHRGSPDDVDWTGYLTFPGQDPTARALRVDLVLVDDASAPATRLLEASRLLDLLDASVATEVAVELVRLRPHDAEDDSEIHTTYPRDARALAAEFADLDLSVQLVVRAA